MPTDYLPSPLLTDDVALDEALLELVERLAHNAHEVWAEQRMKDGWTFGRERSDEHLRHPCLIPYSELPESEKTYDRKLVLGTVRAILALGFEIRAGTAKQP